MQSNCRAHPIQGGRDISDDARANSSSNRSIGISSRHVPKRAFAARRIAFGLEQCEAVFVGVFPRPLSQPIH